MPAAGSKEHYNDLDGHYSCMHMLSFWKLFFQTSGWQHLKTKRNLNIYDIEYKAGLLLLQLALFICYIQVRFDHQLEPPKFFKNSNIFSGIYIFSTVGPWSYRDSIYSFTWMDSEKNFFFQGQFSYQSYRFAAILSILK